MKTVILALDGLEWNVVMDNLGTLPNFRRMMKEGSCGKLKTDHPILSPILWSTIFSGVNPNIHGVTGWTQDSVDVRVPRIWDILESNGYSTGTFDVLTTYPLIKHTGFCLPDGITARSEKAYPAELGDLLKLAFQVERGEVGVKQSAWYFNTLRRLGCSYSTLLDIIKYMVVYRRQGLKQEFYRKRWIKTNMYYDVFKQLMPTVDVSIFYTNLLDAVGAYYWKDYDTTEITPLSHVVPDSYRLIDKIVGHAYRNNDNVFIVSDHGMQPNKEVSQMNKFDATKYLKLIGVEDTPCVNMIHTGYFNITDKKTKEWFVNYTQSLEVWGKRLFKVTQDKYGYLIVGIDKTNIAKEDIFKKGVFKTIKVYKDGKRFCKLGDIFTLTDLAVSGDHSEYATFMAKGSNIKGGYKFKDGTIYDFLPTVLCALDVPLPANYEGQVIDEMFVNYAIPPVKQYKYKRSYPKDKKEVDDKVRKRLETLGYL